MKEKSEQGRAGSLVERHTFDGSKVFFTSDTHFNHTNILKFCDRLYRDLAYKGYPIAMYNYGMMLSLGRGVKKNLKRAAMWNDRAADAGLDIAMTHKAIRLAYLNESPDYKTAFDLFSRAAALGDETAIYQLGRFYLKGIHVEQDYEKVAEWFQKAVENGEGCFAELSLAKCYHTGKGVPKDEEKARELLSQAIKHGRPKKL